MWCWWLCEHILDCIAKFRPILLLLQVYMWTCIRVRITDWYCELHLHVTRPIYRPWWIWNFQNSTRFVGGRSTFDLVERKALSSWPRFWTDNAKCSVMKHYWCRSQFVELFGADVGQSANEIVWCSFRDDWVVLICSNIVVFRLNINRRVVKESIR
jgi:hypothetical protein